MNDRKCRLHGRKKQDAETGNTVAGQCSVFTTQMTLQTKDGK